MHYHSEVVIPPTDNVEDAIRIVMSKFDENDEEFSFISFWDYYVVGGRWSGEKLKSKIDPEGTKLEEFYKELEDREVTVAGFQAGKQSISPEDQIPMVDDIWRKHFPNGGDVCPLFDHFPKHVNSDICTVKEIEEDIPNLNTFRLIVANKSNESTYMLTQEYWNGVNHQKTDWSGKVVQGLNMYREYMKMMYKGDWGRENTASDDWLVVTVDYHS